MPWRAGHARKRRRVRRSDSGESVPDARKGTALTAGAHLSVGTGEESAERAGPEGKKENGRQGVFWAAGKKRRGGKRTGRRGRKRREKKAGPAGLKWLRGKKNVLHFLETTQAHSIQIRIQEFKFKLNPNKKNNAVRHECNTKEQPYLI